MLERLMRGHERAGQFFTDLTIFAATLAGIAAGAFTRTSRTVYPLRCSRCGRPIRVATREHPASGWGTPMYRDARGHYACDGTIRTRHTPGLPERSI
jgi:hypothetical protein